VHQWYQLYPLCAMGPSSLQAWSGPQVSCAAAGRGSPPVVGGWGGAVAMMWELRAEKRPMRDDTAERGRKGGRRGRERERGSERLYHRKWEDEAIQMLSLRFLQSSSRLANIKRSVGGRGSSSEECAEKENTADLLQTYSTYPVVSFGWNVHESGVLSGWTRVRTV